MFFNIYIFEIYLYIIFQSQINGHPLSKGIPFMPMFDVPRQTLSPPSSSGAAHRIQPVNPGARRTPENIQPGVRIKLIFSLASINSKTFLVEIWFATNYYTSFVALSLIEPLYLSSAISCTHLLHPFYNLRGIRWSTKWRMSQLLS